MDDDSYDLGELAGSIKIDWYIARDSGKLGTLAELYDRLEDVLTSAISQLVEVYVDGEDRPPVRVTFDLGGKEIEIDDGPVNGLLDDLRQELE